MKIKELKEFLKDVPDHVETGLYVYHDDWGVHYSLCYKNIEGKIVYITDVPVIKENYVGY